MMEQENTTTSNNSTKHFYCDLPAEVMAKPNTLCNLIEQTNPKIALIYSNSMDVQLVENRLCKRGFKTRKLLFPVTETAKLQEMIEKDNIQCIVLTDNSTSSFAENSIDVIINYSSDNLSGDSYKNRASLLNESGKIFTLVSARDYSDFSTFSRSLELDIQKAALPEEKDLSHGKVDKFITSVEKNFSTASAADKEVAAALLAKCGVDKNAANYETLQAIVTLAYSKNASSLLTPIDKSLDEEINFGLGEDEEVSDESYDDEEMECDEDCDCHEEMDEDSEDHEEEEQSMELQGEPPSTVKVRINQGLNHGLTEKELRTLLREFADIQDDEVLAMEIQEEEGNMEIVYGRFEDLIDNLNGIEQNGESLIFEPLTPVKMKKKPRPDYSNFREDGGFREGRGGRSGGGRRNGGGGGYRGRGGRSGGGRRYGSGGGGGRGGRSGGGRNSGGGNGRYADNNGGGDSRGGYRGRGGRSGGSSGGGGRRDNRRGDGGGYRGGNNRGRSSRSSNYNR